MRKNQRVRMGVDCAMTVVLLLLMGYSRIGEMAHEWLGMLMFTLFVVHHILNRKWSAGLLRGNYTPLRVFQTALAALIFVTMLGSAISGMILSRYIFSWIDLNGAAMARTVHMLSGYWSFVLISLHLGLHWGMIVGMVSKKIPEHKRSLAWIARAAAMLVACYGGYAMMKRQVLEYLFGITRFAFIDGYEPVVLFLVDYIAMMGLYTFVGHYLSMALKMTPKGRKG